MREETVVVRRGFDSAAEWEHSDADEGLAGEGGRGLGGVVIGLLHVNCMYNKNPLVAGPAPMAPCIFQSAFIGGRRPHFPEPHVRCASAQGG